VDKIVAYEQGDLTNDETIELFQELVNSGLAWQMGGLMGLRAGRAAEQQLNDYRVFPEPPDAREFPVRFDQSRRFDPAVFYLAAFRFEAQ